MSDSSLHAKQLVVVYSDRLQDFQIASTIIANTCK